MTKTGTFKNFFCFRGGLGGVLGVMLRKHRAEPLWLREQESQTFTPIDWSIKYLEVEVLAFYNSPLNDELDLLYRKLQDSRISRLSSFDYLDLVHPTMVALWGL